MEEEIEEKIKSYCKKINMKMDNISMSDIDGEYIVTDGYTSVIFDKDGKVASFPIHKAYGNDTTQFIGKSSAMFMYVTFALAIILVLVYNLIVN